MMPLLVLYSYALCAELPPVTAAEIWERILTESARFERLQVVYSITYGTVADEEIDGVFVPKKPPYVVEAEYAADLGKEREFLFEDMMTGDQSRYLEFSLANRGLGAALHSTAPGDSRLEAVLEDKLPTSLTTDHVGHWRPKEGLFGMIRGMDLATALQAAPDLILEHEILGGLETYKLSFTAKEKKQIDVGSPVTAQRDRKMRIWLVPSQNMIPARIESDLDSSGIPAIVRTVEEWSSSEDGKWFPKKIRSFHRLGKEHVVAEITIATWRTGAAANVPNRLRFPAGTRVTNVTEHRKFVVEPEKETGGELKVPVSKESIVQYDEDGASAENGGSKP